MKLFATLFLIATTSVHAFVTKDGATRPAHFQLSQSSKVTDVEDAAATAAGGVRREKILKEPNLWEYNFGLQDPKITLPHGIVKDVSLPEKFEITEEQIRTLEEDGVVHLSLIHI